MHLCDQSDREDVAVEFLLDLLPLIYPEWYESIGIDPNWHWALVRPILRTPMLRQSQAEIDIIFGRMSTIMTSSGVAKVVWPPPTDFTVAVEAKCPVVKWEDMESWAAAATPKSNLRQQLERDIALGFHRVAALHVVATPPSNGFWDAIRTADTLSTYFLPCAERQISALTGELPVGHTILSIAGLAWKHERMSAVTMPRKIVPAPVAGTGPVKAVRDQVESVLENCAEPTVGRAIFVRRASGWQQLDSSSVEP
jgi:hypothetical protein